MIILKGDGRVLRNGFLIGNIQIIDIGDNIEKCCFFPVLEPRINFYLEELRVIAGLILDFENDNLNICQCGTKFNKGYYEEDLEELFCCEECAIDYRNGDL